LAMATLTIVQQFCTISAAIGIKGRMIMWKRYTLLPVAELGSTRKQQTRSTAEVDPSSVESVTGDWRLGLSSPLIIRDIVPESRRLQHTDYILETKHL
jgi:hypothetical protein